MLCDYHIHSTLSGDGSSSMEEQVLACAQRGINKLCFTEHMDLGLPGGLFETDLPRYWAEFQRAKALNLGPKLFLGLEMGYTGEVAEALLTSSKALPFDFLLLSRHTVGGLDPYDQALYFEGKSREFAAREYLEAVHRSVVSFPDYDAVAHIGYVFKFTGERFPPLRHADAPDVMDAILLHLAQNGKALELNTSRWNGEGMPGRDVFARFKALGGEFVTLGSDAHDVGGVAKGFMDAAELIKSLGFRYLASFEGRRLVMEGI
ncbi:MAG: histidinol-phosphatase HisJ family protein [Christensenellaceae bacterium]|jgi:histidinol-phosphatase (PHP family)|nr:histidinol-phosphatase HisJ family protein [Christensenellaceae bacterium]